MDELESAFRYNDAVIPAVIRRDQARDRSFIMKAEVKSRAEDPATTAPGPSSRPATMTAMTTATTSRVTIKVRPPCCVTSFCNEEKV